MSAVGVIALVMGIVSAALIWHKKYPDGLIGKLALGGVVVGALIMVLSEIMDVAHYEAEPEVIMLLSGVAVFHVRHFHNFIRWTRRGFQQAVKQ